MDEHAANDNAPQTGGDLGPKPVTAPQPPYDPAKFNLYYWLCFGLAIGGVVFVMTIIGAIIGFPLLLAASVLGAMFSYMAWKQIQDGHQRTSPGLAVGLMFVPLFNFYWIFVAFLGLAKGVNDYNVRWNISAPPVNEGFALTASILFACSIPAAFIPIIGWFAPLVSTVFIMIVMFQIKNASAGIAEARLEGVGHPAG